MTTPAPATRLRRPAAEAGSAGLRHSNGVVMEEYRYQLAGKIGRATFAEMERDPIVSAVLLAIWQFVVDAGFHVEPAEEAEDDQAEDADGDTPAKAAAKFVEECLDDTSHTWPDFMSELSSMLTYGWAAFEVVYKLRQGEQSETSETPSSKYADGKIGWRKFAPRPQDTLVRWDFDAAGGVQGMRQQVSGEAMETELPVSLLLLFKTRSRKNNPEGQSVLWSAYDPWYYRKRLKEISAIGVERNVAGIPKIDLPSELINEGGPKLQMWMDVGEGLRADEMAYLIVPSDVNELSKTRDYDVSLLSAGNGTTAGSGAEEQIARYSMEIALAVLMDVIFLGHTKIGTQALASEKRKLLDRTIQGIADAVAAVFSRYAIPRLMRLNGFARETWPEMKAGDVGEVDLGQLGTYISALANAGAPLWPDETLANHLRRVAGLPEQPDDFDEKLEEERMRRIAEARSTFAASQQPDDGEEDPTPPKPPAQQEADDRRPPGLSRASGD